MNFQNTNGSSYTLSVEKYRKGRTTSSQPHTNCRKLIKQLFPCSELLEELPIKINRTTLFLDFYLPFEKLAIEVNGKQHREYNPHFFSTKLDFAKALNRDKRKVCWCEMNGIDLITLRDDQQDEWETHVKGRTSQL